MLINPKFLVLFVIAVFLGVVNITTSYIIDDNTNNNYNHYYSKYTSEFYPIYLNTRNIITTNNFNTNNSIYIDKTVLEHNVKSLHDVTCMMDSLYESYELYTNTELRDLHESIINKYNNWAVFSRDKYIKYMNDTTINITIIEKDN